MHFHIWMGLAMQGGKLSIPTLACLRLLRQKQMQASGKGARGGNKKCAGKVLYPYCIFLGALECLNDPVHPQCDPRKCGMPLRR